MKEPIFGSLKTDTLGSENQSPINKPPRSAQFYCRILGCILSILVLISLFTQPEISRLDQFCQALVGFGWAFYLSKGSIISIIITTAFFSVAAVLFLFGIIFYFFTSDLSIGQMLLVLFFSSVFYGPILFLLVKAWRIENIRRKEEKTLSIQKFCYSCGKKMQINSNFCSKCGTEITLPIASQES